MLKTMGKKIFSILCKKNCLSKPMVSTEKYVLDILPRIDNVTNVGGLFCYFSALDKETSNLQ